MLWAGMERALQGKMAFSHIARASCGLYPDILISGNMNMCRDPGHPSLNTIQPSLDYNHHVEMLLDRNIRAGDVLALTTFKDRHLIPPLLDWYREYWVPKLAQKGENDALPLASTIY